MKNKLISLSGIDGTGKSTQIRLLVKHLRDLGFKVNAGESMFTYFLLKPVIRFLRSTTNSPTDGPVSINTKLWPKLWFIPAFMDIWAGYIFKIRSLVAQNDFVIADRFYTDIWANLLYYGYCPNWVFSFLIKLLPQADVAIVLLADPKIIFKREQEFPNAYYFEQEKIYQRLTKLVKCKTLDASQKPTAVFKNILPIVLQSPGSS